MIDYRIKTFLKLCETMNYRKTAEQLNMTQPAVHNTFTSLKMNTNASYLYMIGTLYKLPKKVFC